MKKFIPAAPAAPALFFLLLHAFPASAQTQAAPSTQAVYGFRQDLGLWQGLQMDSGGNLLVKPTSASGATAAQACVNSTIAATPTQILVASATRQGGGFAVPGTASQGIFFSWNSVTPGATVGGTTFYLPPGGTVSFGPGAPSNALWAQTASGTVVGSCYFD